MGDIQEIDIQKNDFDLQFSDIADDRLIISTCLKESLQGCNTCGRPRNDYQRSKAVKFGTFIYFSGVLKYPRKYCIPYFTWLQTSGGIYGAGLGHAGSEINMCMVAPHTIFPVLLTAHSASQAWPHHGPLAQQHKCRLS